MENIQKKFREIIFFDFATFSRLLNFLAHKTYYFFIICRCDGKRSQRIHDYWPWNGSPFHGLFGCHFNLSPETETEEPC